MSNASDDKSKQSTDKDAETKSPLGVKSEAFKKLTDSELDEVAGGLRPRSDRPTLNPTSTDGCCG